ncbi:MAG: ATP synthase F1 subunit delta [Myxococcota bacterium]
MSDAVSRRYAQALIELASEADVVEKVGVDLDTFVRAAVGEHGEQGELQSALASPVFTVEERRAVLDKVLGKIKVHKLTKNLLRLVNDKHRMALLGSIADAYRAMADDREGRARATIESAEELSPALEAEVRSALEAVTGKTVVLRTVVRPELIGGLVARVGDKVYDSSLRTRLELLRQNLLRSPVAQA